MTQETEEGHFDGRHITLIGLDFVIREVFQKKHGQHKRDAAWLAFCFAGAYGMLLPGEPALDDDRAAFLAEIWIDRVRGAIIDARFSMATALVWPNVIQCSEGNFSKDICGGGDENRRMFTAAARALRVWLSDGQDFTTVYLERPRTDAEVGVIRAAQSAR